MKILADIVDRYKALEVVANDPNVFNCDGSKVDPYKEIAAEISMRS